MPAASGKDVVGRGASPDIGSDDRVVDRDGAAGDVEAAAMARGGDGVLGDRGVDRGERPERVIDAAARDRAVLRDRGVGEVEMAGVVDAAAGAGRRPCSG